MLYLFTYIPAIEIFIISTYVLVFTPLCEYKGGNESKLTNTKFADANNSDYNKRSYSI